MTDFTLSSPLGTSRILRVVVAQRMRSDLVCERMWLNNHIQHIFEFPFQVLTDVDVATLRALFVATRGRYLGDIAYTDIWDSVGYTCRLDSDSLSIQGGQPIWASTIRLIEVANFKALKPVVDTFPATVPFQLPAVIGHHYSTVIGAALNDTEKRYEDMADANGIRSWGVGGDVLTNDQAEDLLDCWEGNGGPYRGFAFDDPTDSNVYNAHFVEQQLVHRMVDIRSDGEFVNSIRTVVEELRSSDSDS